jgi:hypothetical protein
MLNRSEGIPLSGENKMLSLTNIVLLDFAIGILIGEILDFIYDLKINNKEDKYLKGVPTLQSFFHWFEHYHWGMVLLMFYCPILNGLGVSLILDENRSGCRFGYEKEEDRDEYYHFKESSIIGTIIFAVLILRWVASVLNFL